MTKCCCDNHSKIVTFTVCSTERNNLTPAMLFFGFTPLSAMGIFPDNGLQSTVVSQAPTDRVLMGFSRLVFHPPTS